jgi:hypothetical protein
MQPDVLSGIDVKAWAEELRARIDAAAARAETKPTTLKLVPPLVRRAMWRKPRLVPVIWCLRDMLVFVQKPRHRAWVPARVQCMVGYRARLSNPMHGIDGWYHIDSIRVRHDDHLAMP